MLQTPDPLETEKKNTPPIILIVVEGRQATEVYITKMITNGFVLSQWSIESVPTEGYAPGAKDRYHLLLVHSRILKMQEDALK